MQGHYSVPVHLDWCDEIFHQVCGASHGSVEQALVENGRHHSNWQLQKNWRPEHDNEANTLSVTASIEQPAIPGQVSFHPVRCDPREGLGNECRRQRR